MHLKHLTISNFRSVVDLDMGFAKGANLVVGPNAVGKTTVLEAIRVAKAVLAPRTQQETRQVLIALGVTSPHLPQSFNFSSIAGDLTKPVIVNCTFELSESELTALPGLIEKLARQAVAAQQGITMDNGPFALIQLLSTHQGQGILASARQYALDNIAIVTQTKQCRLFLTISPDAGFQGLDGFAQLLYTVLENELSPSKTRFSYFPADRALPTGEAQIQLGAADAQQQMESHNSTPANKYQRLKSSIFSSFVESTESQEKQKQVFEALFNRLLKGKSIESFSINLHGQASILIKDLTTSKTFDIDAMSSGEKGLILTFLIISRSMESGGVILLDEPELHLNSAVCKDLLEFLLDEYLIPNNLQAIICTHSPEVMSTAMRRDECTVYHLRRGAPSTIIRKHDQPEAVQALRLLGTSEIEELLYEAVIFVEGPDDVELLEGAFQETLSRFRFRPLGGRPEVEKHIKELQAAEVAGLKENISYFVFDGDNRLSDLKSTKKVVVKQWEKYCLENYLLDIDILFDLIRREFSVKNWPQTIGEASGFFRDIAYKQLKPLVIEEVYRTFQFESLGIRNTDKRSATFEAAGDILFARVASLQKQIVPLSEHEWTKAFKEACDELLQQKQLEWSTSWQSKCSGKQFLKDLFIDCKIAAPALVIKRRLVQESKFAANGKGTDLWRLMRGTLADLIDSH
jgi:predicted ATP-dependent endonuclease of OLD family